MRLYLVHTKTPAIVLAKAGKSLLNLLLCLHLRGDIRSDRSAEGGSSQSQQSDEPNCGRVPEEAAKDLFCKPTIRANYLTGQSAVTEREDIRVARIQYLTEFFGVKAFRGPLINNEVHNLSPLLNGSGGCQQ